MFLATEVSPRILQLQLQQQVQEMVLVPKTVNQMVVALPRARVLIILLHHGILYDVAFAGGVVENNKVEDSKMGRERRGWG